MEGIIRKVISIDRNARDIVRGHEQEIMDKEAAAREELKQFKINLMKQVEKKGRMRFDELKKKAEIQGAQIETESREQTEAIERQYLAVKKQMERDIFRNIFLDEGEEIREP